MIGVKVRVLLDNVSRMTLMSERERNHAIPDTFA